MATVPAQQHVEASAVLAWDEWEGESDAEAEADEGGGSASMDFIGSFAFGADAG